MFGEAVTVSDTGSFNVKRYARIRTPAAGLQRNRKQQGRAQEVVCGVLSVRLPRSILLVLRLLTISSWAASLYCLVRFSDMLCRPKPSLWNRPSISASGLSVLTDRRNKSWLFIIYYTVRLKLLKYYIKWSTLNESSNVHAYKHTHIKINQSCHNEEYFILFFTVLYFSLGCVDQSATSYTSKGSALA